MKVVDSQILFICLQNEKVVMKVVILEVRITGWPLYMHTKKMLPGYLSLLECIIWTVNEKLLRTNYVQDTVVSPREEYKDEHHMVSSQ